MIEIRPLLFKPPPEAAGELNSWTEFERYFSKRVGPCNSGVQPSPDAPAGPVV
jgi:hypothetical protein